MKNLTYSFIVAVTSLCFLMWAQLTPRYDVRYDIEELNLYWSRVDSLCVEISKRDSLITLLRGELHVSEWNNKGVVAQLDMFTEGK